MDDLTTLKTEGARFLYQRLSVYNRDAATPTIKPGS